MPSLRLVEAVFGVVTKPALGDGAFGEYVTAPVAYTALVPAGLDLAAAGALGLADTAALPPSTRWPRCPASAISSWRCISAIVP